MNHNLRWLILGILLSLTACTTSVEGAILSELERDHTAVSAFRIRQTASWDRGQIVQKTFASLDDSGTPQLCEGVGYLERGVMGWQPRSSGRGCAPPASMPGPLELVGSSGGGGTGYTDWTAASGLVEDPAGVEVRITWRDGRIETVPVVDGSYLSLRPGAGGYAQVELLDANGNVIGRFP